jgi:GTP-binding nuclear protein Ran
MTDQKHFKLIVVGDGNVGKTTFIKRHLTGEFDKRYIPTMGVEVHPMGFHTSEGKVLLNIWDCAGDVRFQGLRESYYIGADAAVIFFDIHEQSSYKSVEKWYNLIKHAAGDIPIVICGNKVDKQGRKVLPNEINIHRRLGLQYYDVSAKSNYNFEKPFLRILRKLKNNDNLCFTTH